MKKIYDLGQFVDIITAEACMLDLAKRARRRRKEAGFSQRSLAERSRVSYASIRRFESTGEISLYSLLRIAEALGTIQEFTEVFSSPIIKNLKDYKPW